jgi:hypothetical protein
MLERGITNHETAAEYHQWMKQAAVPTSSSYNPSPMNKFDLSNYWKNPQTAARNEAQGHALAAKHGPPERARRLCLTEIVGHKRQSRAASALGCFTLLDFGSDAQKQKFLPQIASGQRLGGLEERQTAAWLAPSARSGCSRVLAPTG